ncbi:hypothetical protein [Paenibacillus sp. BC26]|uniref:hypothetical protein n=1 Tax=Paenibacillus sp. BC26 TaxID=1881032 RepID=UPI0008DF3823|nr:hypothetical protein [Paenibacillus sp. BC26]SFS64757.1 hypothetical protein SAMN05428962_1868 [Paenibacillus sp. BC26]
MKIIVNVREIKEFFDGLARLLLPHAAQPAAAESGMLDISALVAEIRQAIREEIASALLEEQRDVGASSLNKLGRVFEPYTGKSAELLTPAGTVEGTITKVDGDFLVVREHGGTSVMVPLEQLVTFQLIGRQVER